MEIQWLREFLQLTKTLNYRQTAEQLHITPSTLSKHIMLIEKELDTQLFIRDTKSVELTDSGRIFRDGASNMLREYEASISQMKRGGSVVGDLRIGGGLRFTKLNEIIHPMIAHFEKKYPDVRLTIVDTQYQDYRETLVRGGFDVVFSIRLPTMDETGLEYRDLFELPLCAWITSANRYADCESVTLEQLSTLDLRILEEEKCKSYANYLKDLFAERGLEAKVGKSMNQAMVFGGDDYGLTPNFNPADHFGFGMRSIPVSDGGSIRFSMVRKRSIGNPITALFCAEFESLFAPESMIEQVR